MPADTGLSTWGTSAGPVRWGLLGVGALATLLLIFRFGQIVAKLGLAMPVVDDLGFAGEATSGTPTDRMVPARRPEMK